MKRLSSIGVASVFKMSLVLGATAGLIAGVVLMIGSFAEKKFLEGVLFLVCAPIIYGLMGAVVNAAMAWIYNAAAARLGGIDITFEE